MKPILFLISIIFSSYFCEAQATIPGRIEAELYDNMSGVQTQQTADSGGGLNVGWIDKGDFMDYKVNVVAQGFYTVNFRLACTTAGASFEILSNGAVLAVINPPVTGDYQSFVTVSTQVGLQAGMQTIRLLSLTDPPWNINWFSFTPAPANSVISFPNVTQVVDSAFSTLDSVVIKDTSTKTLTTFAIDTLFTTGAQTFLISVGGFDPSNGDDVSAVRLIRIKTFNGVTSVVRSVDPMVWLGQNTSAKTSWTTTVINNKVLVKVTTAANLINWTHKRYSL